MLTYISEYDSALGKIYLASNEKALIGLWFENQKYFESTIQGERMGKDTPVLIRTKEWLDVYFDYKEPDFIPEISFEGTPFQKKVWNELLKIPYGKTITYMDIAKKLGISSARAVGQAVGHNPISIIVPCHRVIGANHKITGYAGGIDKKIALLEIEGYDLTILK